MANQIYELPDENDAGLDFDYDRYQPNTEVTLCNVRFDNTYKDILSPAGLAGLDAYIDGLSDAEIFENVVPVRASEPIVIPVPYNKASNYNYMRVVSKARPVVEDGPDIDRTYYYFITGFYEDSSNGTRVMLQLDVWATFGRSVSIISAFVDRSHAAIAATNATEDWYDRYLTVPEGLDVGTDYRPTWSVVRDGFNLADAMVLVVSNTRLEGPWFDGDGLPIKRTSTGGTFSGLPSGASFYIFTRSDLRDFMIDVSSAPHIAQGIMSITLIPEMDRFWPDFEYDPYPTLNRAPAAVPTRPVSTVFADFREESMLIHYPRYRDLKKFATSPYMMIELTNNAGSSTHIKPEMVGSDDLTMVEQVNFVPPGQRYVAWLRNVLTSGMIGPVSSQEMSRGLPYAAVNSGFPTLPMVNDAGTLYLTQNARGIQNGLESAEWSRDKAVRSSQVSYDQATKGMNTDVQNQAIGWTAERQARQINSDASWEQTGIGAVSSLASGGLGGLSAGPKAGAAGAAMAAAGIPFMLLANGSSQNQQNALLNNAQQASMQQMGNNRSAGEYMRDTNAELASFAANGDYENQVAGILAKNQDAKLAPNSMVGSFGGESFNLVNGVPVFMVHIKQIRDGVARRIGEYWLRYGYAIERYITVPASLMTMSRFTYWKMSEVYMNAAPMPEVHKHAIRGIFEKGVTVWDNPALIGNFGSRNPSAAPVNQPLPGVTL